MESVLSLSPEAVVEIVLFEPNRDGILRLLNRFASHNDNG